MEPQPAFNIWTTGFSIAAFQAFFIAFVLFRWNSGHRQGNLLLAALLAMFGLTLCEYVFYWTSLIARFPHVANLTAHFPFLFGPLLFFYFRTIYENHRVRRLDWLHMVPFLITVALFLPWYLKSGADKADIVTGRVREPEVNRWVAQVIAWSRIGHMFAYVIWNFLYIRTRARVGFSTRWARLLNSFFLGFAVAYLSYFVLVRFPFFNIQWDYHISLTLTAFIFLIAYAGYVQPAVFEGFALTEPSAPAKYKNSGLNLAASQNIARKLAELMKNERLYREPELRLDDLSARLGVGKHLVSQVINEQLGMSFFDYVNALRIEDARQLLTETSKREMNVIEVAYAVGFNNKVSFNNTFKKTTGMTPTEYRKQATAV